VRVSGLEAAGQSLRLVLAELPDGRLEAPLPAALHDALVVLAGAARHRTATTAPQNRESPGRRDPRVGRGAAQSDKPPAVSARKPRKIE